MNSQAALDREAALFRSFRKRAKSANLCPVGCVSQGTSREEALENIREAIAACLEVRAEQGMPLTVETRQVDVEL